MNTLIIKSIRLTLCLLLLNTPLAYSQSATYAIIPKPAKLVEQKGAFALINGVSIVLEKDNADTRRIATQLADRIGTATGNRPAIRVGKAGNQSIYFASDKTGKAGKEGYSLTVTPRQITIMASQPNGAFYGMQSLLQLMPTEIFSPMKAANVSWSVPACTVEDEPRFGYRGLMLDVARHFMPVSFVKKYIDLLALHKQNTLHWHLTDDQGWRIEIKKYPLLTQVGSQRKQTMAGRYGDNKYDGTPYGGFYTQDEVREVVKYAQERFVTVIPEIEMPGHARSILAGYPQLGASADKIVPVGTKWGVFDQVLFPREETFTFLQDVLTEVIGLFPSQYIHVGGDECPKTEWEHSRFCQELMKKEGLKDEHELQSYFIQRMDKFITSKGRKMIGWDEILEGGLSPNATVMSWRGTQGGIAAAKQGHDAIMSPNDFCYLDHYQFDAKTVPTVPIAIGGYLPLEKVYSYEPIPDTLSTDITKHIIGVQGNLWTEYVRSPEYAEYMVWPRASALAEIGWSPRGKDLADFNKRLDVQKKRLDQMSVNYFGAPINDKFPYQMPKEASAKK